MDKQSQKLPQTQIEILAFLCSDDPARQAAGLEAIQHKQSNWADILLLAQQHHVSPLLYRCLNHHQDQSPLTDIQQAQLRQICRNIKMHNLRTETELLRISQVLNHAEIRHIVYKGPALARQVFGDLGWRQFNDYDLLTSEDDTYRVQEIMAKVGYTPIVPLNAIQKRKLHYFEKEITYIREERGHRRYEADIHWMLLRPALNVPLTFETLWEHTAITRFGDVECRTLDETYTFLSTCIHNGGNEAWHTLKQVADLDAILRQWHERIHWPEVWRMATQFDLELLIGSALLLTHAVFQSPVPAEELHRARQSQKAVRIADALKLFPYPAQLTRWPAIREHLHVRRSIWNKARILGHSLLESLSPNFADEEFLRLPKAHRLFGLYYFIRPIRVLFKGKNVERF